MIEFRNLHKSFDDHAVLRGVDLLVEEGETLALLGPSGTGKSVLIKHAMGLLEPDAGDVVVDGISIASATRDQLLRVRRSIGYVFQNAALFDSLTVAENLWLAQTDEREGRPLAGCRTEGIELLQRVNLDASVMDKYPSELSGGMRKRVGVARAIAHQPRYLLWDEPTTGLDPINSAAVERLIKRLSEELEVTSLLVTHDVEGGLMICDRVAMLDGGTLRFCGTPEEFRSSQDPVVRAFVDRAAAEAALDIVGT